MISKHWAPSHFFSSVNRFSSAQHTLAMLPQLQVCAGQQGAHDLSAYDVTFIHACHPPSYCVNWNVIW